MNKIDRLREQTEDHLFRMQLIERSLLSGALAEARAGVKSRARPRLPQFGHVITYGRSHRTRSTCVCTPVSGVVVQTKMSSYSCPGGRGSPGGVGFGT